MDINRGLVSVLLPVYNGEKYISEALESIINQTYRNIEIIVVNDGSVDQSDVIIKAFDDSRLQVISLQENVGLINALNVGLNLCKGHWILRFDADDVASPQLIEKKMYSLRKNPDAKVINHLNWLLKDGGVRFDFFRYYPFTSIINFTVLFDNTISHPGALIRTDVLKDLRYTDDGSVDYFEDVDLWYRVLKNGGRVSTLRKRLLQYRILESGINKAQSKSKDKVDRRVNYVINSLGLISSKELNCALRALFLAELNGSQARIIYTTLKTRYVQLVPNSTVWHVLDFHAWLNVLLFRRINRGKNDGLLRFTYLTRVFLNPLIYWNILLNSLSKYV